MKYVSDNGTSSSGTDYVDYELVTFKRSNNTQVSSTSGSVTSGDTISFTSTEPVKSFNLFIQKQSDDPDVTDDNNCYSYLNAVYTLYGSNSATFTNLTAIDTITVNGSGEGTKTEIPLNTTSSGNYLYYYVKETSSSQGYFPDETIWKLQVTDTDAVSENISYVLYSDPDGNGFNIIGSGTVASGSTISFTSSQITKQDPLGIELYKTQEIDNPYNYVMAGAQFTIKYYDGQYSTYNQISGLTPTRVWVIQTAATTNSAGETVYRAKLDEDHLVAVGTDGTVSDPLYYYGDQIVVPIGTITIQETCPVEGYIAHGAFYQGQSYTIASMSELTPIYTITPGSENPNYDTTGDIYLINITEDTSDSGATMVGGNYYNMEDKEEFCSLTLSKTDADQEGIPGVEYMIELLNQQTGEYDVQSFIKTTEADGSWTYSLILGFDQSETGNNRPTTDQTGTLHLTNLPFGWYRITETKTSDNHNLLSEPIEVYLAVESTETNAGIASDSHIYTYTSPYTGTTTNYYTDVSYHVIDTQITDIPFTGASGLYPFLIVGIIAAGAAGFVCFNFAKKRNRLYR